jgi:bifunctional pyridoxal-dependent enzyme with beta-cystathionase and maltose regulon repressor activities
MPCRIEPRPGSAPGSAPKSGQSSRGAGRRYVPPEASYLAWVDCSALNLGPEPAEVFLRRGRVALGRGLDFGAPGDGFVRVTIGTSSALLADIADLMAAAAAGLSVRPG